MLFQSVDLLDDRFISPGARYALPGANAGGPSALKITVLGY